MTISRLREMSRTDIKATDVSRLVDIQSITIDSEQNICDRMQEYVKQIENPYCFLVGNTPVKISFSDQGNSLDNALLHYFLSLKQ